MIFAALQFQQPPERATTDDVFITFSDCKMHDGVRFGDIAEPLAAWAQSDDE